MRERGGQRERHGVRERERERAPNLIETWKGGPQR